MEVGINVEGGIFWKKLEHKCNKRGVESQKSINVEGGNVLWRVDFFFKISKCDFTVFREMRISSNHSKGFSGRFLMLQKIYTLKLLIENNKSYL